MASTKHKSKQKLNNHVVRHGKQQQGKKAHSLLCWALSQMPGSMNSKYLISLSMAMNVILLTRLVYEKNYHTIPKRAMGEGKSYVNQTCLPQQEMPANSGCVMDPKHIPDGGQMACSGQGYYVKKNPSGPASDGGICKCHACFAGHNCSSVVSNCIINLDHGDPTMFESFWFENGQKSTTVILAWESMSYFADVGNICWFLEPELGKEIRSLHNFVGNAVTVGRHIVIGTGSTQLFQAALYALSPQDRCKPTSVVSAAPFYSSYPSVTDYLRSEIYRWAGDAWKFKQTSEEDSYIELVTSPNNPDGFTRQAVVNGSGPVVYDFAYYWPHYTPITAPADEDLMLFTVSKSTGHAGSRIGWAIVKDAEVARKMTKYIELNTIGVSKDSQLRATQILRSVTNSYTSVKQIDTKADSKTQQKHVFFHHGSSLMREKWERLRSAVSLNGRFSLPAFEPAFCNFLGRLTTPQPAFAWLKCEGDDEEEDCEKFLRSHGIITRSGRHFGATPNYVRMSILDRNQTFNLLIDRLSTIH